MYVMVTQWSNHWDRIPGNRTRYNDYMLRTGMSSKNYSENEPTIFIKLSESEPHIPENAWIGKVSNISETNKIIHFTVHIEKSIEIPDKYKHLSAGWYFYADRSDQIQTSKQIVPNVSKFSSSFFDSLRKTSNYSEFEESIHVLLKYIGINDVYAFDQVKQAGRADGFFKIRNLAVIYDATLNQNFEVEKNQQIRNYVAALNSGLISYGDLNFTTTSLEKQVWIITKGKTRRLNIIDDIIIKEVSIETLMEVFVKKLQDMTINETEFVNLLRNI